MREMMSFISKKRERAKERESSVCVCERERAGETQMRLTDRQRERETERESVCACVRGVVGLIIQVRALVRAQGSTGRGGMFVVCLLSFGVHMRRRIHACHKVSW